MDLLDLYTVVDNDHSFSFLFTQSNHMCFLYIICSPTFALATIASICKSYDIHQIPEPSSVIHIFKRYPDQLLNIDVE